MTIRRWLLGLMLILFGAGCGLTGNQHSSDKNVPTGPAGQQVDEHRRARDEWSSGSWWVDDLPSEKRYERVHGGLDR
jgi:hypothetical protein